MLMIEGAPSKSALFLSSKICEYVPENGHTQMSLIEQCPLMIGFLGSMLFYNTLLNEKSGKLYLQLLQHFIE